MKGGRDVGPTAVSLAVNERRLSRVQQRAESIAEMAMAFERDAEVGMHVACT